MDLLVRVCIKGGSRNRSDDGADQTRALNILDFRLRKSLLEARQNGDGRTRRAVVIPFQGIETVCIRADHRNS